MADINLKTEAPDTTLPTTGFLFGADSQAASAPSVYSTQTVATTLLGSTSLTGATITTSQPVLDLAQTWNASGVTFTGLKFNATDTASAAASLLMDLQVGGTSQFSITKAGTGFVNGAAAIAGAQFSGNGTAELFGTSALLKASSRWPGGSGVGGRVFLAVFTGVGTNHIAVPSDAQFSWSSSALSTLTSGAGTDVNSTRDLFLTRRGLANLRLGAADAASPQAQILSVQSVVAGTSNTAGQDFRITGSQGTGTGAGGSIIFQVAPAGSSGSAQNALATFLEATSARAFNLYNTTDVTTNFERGKIAWSSNVLQIGTEKGGTGTARALEFQTDGTTRLTIATDGVATFAANVSDPVKITGSASSFGGLFLQNTNTGLSASTGFTAQNNQTAQLLTRVYGSGVTASTVWGITLANYTGVFSLGASSSGLLFGTITATPIVFGTDTSEKMRITSAGLVTFQGTTSSFPALKRSSAALQVRLADDTGYTTIDANHRLQGTAPAANNSTGTAGDIRYDADYIYICTATDTWKRVAIATWP